jgi:flagellar biosynthesis chaperone FliJ
MQTFRFRLEKVLEWYTRQYELEERRFTACLAALAEAKAAIATLQAERLSIERDMLSRAAIPARDFVALGLYRLGAKKREVELNVVRDAARPKSKAQRLKLQAAERRVRLLEKLRERRVAEYTYAENARVGRVGVGRVLLRSGQRGSVAGFRRCGKSKFPETSRNSGG